MTLKKGKITYANQVAETTLGYSLDELMDTQLIELIAPVCHDNIMAILNKSLYGFEVESSEINMVRKNMSELQTEVYYMQPVKDDEDETAVFIAKNITDQKEAERKVLKAIIDTQENERKSFAENLHDELGPFLSGIKLYIDEISSSDISKKEKDKLISYLQEMTDEAIAQTRSISNKLMPNVLINYGLFRAIQKFCQGLSATSKINITLDFNKPDKSYDKRIEVTLYRIIIELINNTLKHANASEIKIKMNDSNTILRLIYQDNGKGFAMEQLHEKEEGLGMQNIISRVKLLNGNVNIWSQPGNGLIVDIELYPHKIEGVAE
jgi:PAS domain S-box-containing protein